MSSTTRAGQPRRERRHEAPTTPAPTTAMRSPRRGARVPQPLTAVSMLAASDGARIGHGVGDRQHRVGRHDVAILMRMEAEDAPADAAPAAPSSTTPTEA